MLKSVIAALKAKAWTFKAKVIKLGLEANVVKIGLEANVVKNGLEANVVKIGLQANVVKNGLESKAWPRGVHNCSHAARWIVFCSVGLLGARVFVNN